MAGSQYVCLNGGNCFNNNGVGICQCLSGYSGNYCGTVLGCNAHGQNCVNGGVCNTNTGICQCPTGYSGSTCSISALSFIFSFLNLIYFLFIKLMDVH